MVPHRCLVGALVVRRRGFHILLTCHLESAPKIVFYTLHFHKMILFIQCSLNHGVNFHYYYCWAALSSPASPVLTQLQDGRKSPEPATETSVVYWMGELRHLKQGPGATPLHVWGTVGRTWGSLCSGDSGLPIIGGIDIRLAHWLPGKPAEEHASHCPFDKLSQWLK